MLYEKLLSRMGASIIMMIIFAPLVWICLSRFEGDFFPVTSDVEIRETKLEYKNDIPVLKVKLFFDKRRKCKFNGLHWYDKNRQRIQIVFPESSQSLPQSRPVGWQLTDYWALIGIDSLDGTHAVVDHSCHVFWHTHTQFYPANEH